MAQTNLTRLRSIRAGVLAAALIAMTLVLSGCFVVYPRGSVDRNITVPRAITDQIIWGCTVDAGTGPARAMCALDTIDDLCRGVRVNGIRESDCSQMGSYGRWQEMEQSIREVIWPHHSPDRACLTFYDGVEYPGLTGWTSGAIGYVGCEG